MSFSSSDSDWGAGLYCKQHTIVYLHRGSLVEVTQMNCKFCQSDEVKVVSSDPYGDDVVVQCFNCGEMFEITKDEVEDDEHNED